MITLYGITNCDTVKKARAWLDANRVEYAFHDYKRDGIDRTTLQRWVGLLGWEALLNRNGTTFRKLPEHARADLSESRAIALMMAQPSMIRRPVLAAGRTLELGFRPEQYARLFPKAAISR